MALWVAGLVVISNDLARPHRELHELMQGDQQEAKAHNVYWLMLGASHLREAVKYLDRDTCPLMSDPDVEGFIDGLPQETCDLLEGIVGEVRPWKESWLHELAKPARDRLFHYAADDDYTDEIGQALDAMASFDRELDFRGRNIDWHWGFGEEIRLNWIAQSADLSLSDYAELVKRSNKLAGRIVKFAGQTVRVYLERRVGEPRGA